MSGEESSSRFIGEDEARLPRELECRSSAMARFGLKASFVLVDRRSGRRRGPAAVCFRVRFVTRNERRGAMTVQSPCDESDRGSPRRNLADPALVELKVSGICTSKKNNNNKREIKRGKKKRK